MAFKQGPTHPDDVFDLTINGHRHVYHRAGAGEPVLLVHGITTYSFIWRKIVPILAEQYDVISIDLLGCGESDKSLDVSYSISTHADRIHAFVNALGIKRFHLIGHDLGGGISQIFAIRHTEMFYDLMLINPVAFDFWPVQPVLALKTPIVRQLMMAILDFGLLELLVKQGMYHKENVTDDLLCLFKKPLSCQQGRKAFMHFARCLDNKDLTDITPQLKTLALPVQLLRGDADPFLSPANIEQLHQAIPDSTLLRIATASHFLMEDEPEWASDNMLAFMKKQHE